MEVNLSDFMTLGLLIGLELVLGIDNILLISIVTGRLKSSEQEKARKLALFLALMFRLWKTWRKSRFRTASTAKAMSII